jgi:hypothetical protein
MASDLMLGASVYRWLVTAQPVDADTARRVVDTVWGGACGHPAGSRRPRITGP